MRLINGVVSVLLVLAGSTLVIVVRANSQSHTSGHIDEDYPDVTPAPPHASSSPLPPPASSGEGEGEGFEEPLPLCPPKPAIEEKRQPANLLIVSTIDGQLSALDLNQDGEMVWSVSMYPGTMLDSTISDMDLDNRGLFVKLIPSLTGRLYKFDGEVVEQIPMDVDSLLGSSQKMQENIVITGGKETRTYGINANTGEVIYECSMHECSKFKESSTEDMFVVQCSTKTVRAHTPKTGDQKWNFSVSLHDVSFYPGKDPCDQNDTQDEGESDDHENVTAHIKTVVPEGIVCATRADHSLKWKHKFQAPIVDVWHLAGAKLNKVNLFSKNHIPRRDGLLDDSVADENPSLYIGKHNNQLYIQESINVLMGNMLTDSEADPTQLDFPRVSWKPYMVSPSRTPIINHGTVEHGNLIAAPPHRPAAYDPVMQREDAKMTALALTSGSAEYPFDSGFYLYTDSSAVLDPQDPVANITGLIDDQTKIEDEEENTVELIYMSLWHWWKEVLMIAIITAIMTNLLITGPIVHNLRDDFQEWSRQLVNHVENLQRERNAQVREVLVEVPVPSLTNNIGSTPSSAATLNSSGPDFSSYMIRQDQPFESRFQSDFQPVQCLGKGGFGIVFESKNKYDDVHYAVKRITLPSSEDSKKKVMREVKLHAKLDHRHIVRYYSTWTENPPPGWEKEADSWFNADEIGSQGPTQFDPTDTEYSVTESKEKKASNPFYQYNRYSNDSEDWSGFSSTNNSDSPFRLPSSSLLPSPHNPYQNNWDDSFSIRFQSESTNNCDNSNNQNQYVSDNDNVDAKGDQKKQKTLKLQCDSEQNVEDDEESSSFGGGFFSKDIDDIGGSKGFPRHYSDDTTSGGIRFDAPPPFTEGICEVIGRREAVSLDLGGETEDGGSVNSDCCDALEWDSKEQKEKVPSPRNLSYLYIVMQLCRKDTLRDWLRNTGIRNTTEILSFFHQICVGVEYVHREGLIHRDLKPSNIYFSHDGVVKIGDFGLVTGGRGSLPGEEPGATALEEAQDDQALNATRTSNHQYTDQVGTQMYMSPEQLAQQAYNHKVDIYSLGLIFLELCVCFSTQMERVQTLTGAKKQIFPDTISSDPQYHNLLTRMLNKNAEERPEAEDILDLEWLQEYRETNSTKRKRLESTTDSATKNA